MKKLEVVCGVIERQGKVLIGKRGKGIRENVWEFPGGKVERNETNEEAIVRELQEELQVSVEVVQFLTAIHDSEEGIDIHVSAYLCHILQGEPSAFVHHEIQWVKPSALAAYGFVKSDEPIIESVRQVVK